MTGEFTINIKNDFETRVQTAAKKADADRKKYEREYKNSLKRMSAAAKKHSDKVRNLNVKELDKTKEISDRQRVYRKQNLDRSVSDEKARYTKSENLAKQLQQTLRSVFERAVFYTAIYKGIQLVNQAFKDWISTNIELDYALAKVNTISKVTVNQMTRLTELSIGTGRSLTDLSESLYQINSSGRVGAEAMTILEVSTNAAVGGFVDAANAADVLTDVLNAYHYETSETQIISDKLLKTVELGKLKWEDYQGVLGRVMPQAYNLGVSLDELLGSLGTLTLSGVKFREATVGMRNIMIKMQKPTRGMTKALMTLNKGLGETYGSVQDVVRDKGLMNTMVLLKDTLDENDASVTDLYNNIRGLTAQYSLMSDEGKKAVEITDKISDSMGTTEEKAAIMADTIKEAQNRLSSAFVALGVDVFSFGDDMKATVNSLSEFVLLLRKLTPIITATIKAIAFLAIGAGILGAKFLIMKTLLPLVSGLFKGMSIASKGATINMGGYTMATQAATAATITLQQAMVIFYAAYVIFKASADVIFGYLKKQNEEEIQIIKNTTAMVVQYYKMRREANLLSKVRPFKNMATGDLGKQIEENNVKLARSRDITKEIAGWEAKLANFYTPGSSDAEIVKEKVAGLKAELQAIIGLNGANLEIMKAMEQEQKNRNSNMSEEALLAEHLAQNYGALKENIEDFDKGRLEKINELLKSKLDRLGNEDLIDLLGVDEIERIRKNIVSSQILVAETLAAKNKELRQQESVDATKAIKKRISFMKKYNDAALNLTLKGRIEIINAERKSVLEEADFIATAANAAAIKKLADDREAYGTKARLDGVAQKVRAAKIKEYNNQILELTQASKADRLAINKVFNAKILSENEKHYDKLIADGKKFFDKLQKEKEDDAKAEEKILDDKLKFTTTYLKTDYEKIKLSYDNKLIKLKETYGAMHEQDAEYIAILKVMDKELLDAEIASTKAVTDAKFEEWKKQHEYLNMMLEASKSAALATSSSISDFLALQTGAWLSDAKVTTKSLNDIWVSWKNSMISLLSEVMVKMAAVWAFQKLLNLIPGGGGFWGGLLKGLIKGFDGIVDGGSADDAIIQDGVITKFRKDDVVAIGTNMYGTRSGSGGTNNSGIEKKLDLVISAINNGTIANIKKESYIPVRVYTDEEINNKNRSGDKINRNIG